jgi:hypothetical protein
MMHVISEPIGNESRGFEVLLESEAVHFSRPCIPFYTVWLGGSVADIMVLATTGGGWKLYSKFLLNFPSGAERRG